MRLIKKGKKIPNLYLGTCIGCGSVWEADEGELKPEFDQREGGSFAHAKCSECGDTFVMYPK